MKNFYKRLAKPAGDRIFAALLIVILFPLMLVIASFTAVFISKKFLFFQARPGKDEKIFLLCKFRTMSDARDAGGELLPDELRLGRAGKFLRASSLDELPELFNVLLGQMSFVGPRPLLVEYLQYYTPRERLRHSVLPGLTGLAQVSGRNALSWEQKFALDLEYVERQSAALDLKILLKTVGVVIFRRGVNSAGSATMEKFKR